MCLLNSAHYGVPQYRWVSGELRVGHRHNCCAWSVPCSPQVGRCQQRAGLPPMCDNGASTLPVVPCPHTPLFVAALSLPVLFRSGCSCLLPSTAMSCPTHPQPGETQAAGHTLSPLAIAVWRPPTFHPPLCEPTLCPSIPCHSLTHLPTLIHVPTLFLPLYTHPHPHTGTSCP